MIFKIFGERDKGISDQRMNFVSQVAQETIKQVKAVATEDDTVQFFDISSPEGAKIAQDEGVSYLPTVICEDDDGLELGFLENQLMPSSLMVRDQVVERSLSFTELKESQNVKQFHRCFPWFEELDKFLVSMLEFKKE